MIYRGHVKDGTILLDEPAELPDGSLVIVELVRVSAETEVEAEVIPSLAERLALSIRITTY